MKRVTLFLFLLPNFLAAQDSLFNFKNAGDYNNFIMQEMTGAARKNFEYISYSVHSEEYDQLEKKRTGVVEEILKVKEAILEMPPLEGDTRLRDEAIKVLEEYKVAFEHDYKNVNSLKRKSKDSFESMEAYFEAEDKAEAKVNSATLQLKKAQRLYAQKHNMEMSGVTSDTVLQLKMNKVIAVNNYWRELFLDYFKVYRQYDRMWDALPQKKASVIDRERIQSLAIIEKVLPLLKAMPDFKGDIELRDQTINLIEYFQTVASERFLRIVEILSMKTMGQKDLDEVNSIINQCNADHERLFYNWNIASRDLFKKNVGEE